MPPGISLFLVELACDRPGMWEYWWEEGWGVKTIENKDKSHETLNLAEILLSLLCHYYESQRALACIMK